MSTPRKTAEKTTQQHTRSAQKHAGFISKLEGTLKLRYLGIGFIWAWVYCSYETPAVYPLRSGMGINSDDSWIVSATVVTIALFAGGILLGRRRRPASTALTLTAAFCATIGTLLSTSTALPAEITIYVSGILTGFGTALLSIIWGQTLAKLDTETSELAIPAASIIMVAGALVFPYLPPAVGAAAAASLPLISGLMLFATQHELGETPPASSLTPEKATADSSASASTDADTTAAAATTTATDTTTAAAATTATDTTATTSPRLRISSNIIKMAILLFIAYVTSGFLEAVFPISNIAISTLDIDWPIIIGSSFGVIIMVSFLLFAQRPTFDTYFKGVAPLIAATMALMIWNDAVASFLKSTFLAITNTILTVATFLCVVNAAQKSQDNAALSIGITQGTLQLGVLIGNIAAQQFIVCYGKESDVLLFAIAALSVLFSLAWYIYPTEQRHYHPRPPGVNATVSHKTTLLDTTITPSDSSLEIVCDQLASAHNLSGREREILGYLARGRSQPYIREELILSKNTVATHVKHIYQKLDVHSRQELLDLIEAAEGELCP
ncbi:LuxR C-terminal-related transcriptional regulator [Adlercreutzia agrestimuris]|uniref:LuxR C-terminal-related transcriptional regulator n=1 Tax=Adlercreutzia agrestimuris TaxID=2941324 RepID=UPI00204021B8|nr:LuxR C-terminal-related transcriptional regulator [Adlercreutzia agrestimuris]